MTVCYLLQPLVRLRAGRAGRTRPVTAVAVILIVSGLILAVVTGWFGLIVSAVGLLILLAALVGFGRRETRAGTE